MRRALFFGLYACSGLAFAPGPASAERTLRPEDIALANRISFGVNDALLDDLSARGAEAWLQAQLHPDSDIGLPPDVAAMIDAMPHLHKKANDQLAEVAALRKKVEDAKAAYDAAQAAAVAPVPAALASATMAPAPAEAKPAPQAPPPLAASQVLNAYRGETLSETQARRVLREIYGQDQLREQMAWFWFNHFNVLWDKGDITYRLADYEDSAIRPNALGKFRTLLEAVMRHPAMVQYLDNAQNAAGHINENYARELMELHTMGVGSGYTQADVEALAHILTGVGYLAPGQTLKVPAAQQALLIHDGDFVFNPARHDFSDKVFLGHTIKGSGYAEVQQALDILCKEPATARFISTKLARLFVSEDPPKSLIDAMAGRFQETDGDIAAVLDLMFHSREFRKALKTPLLKDPEHYVVSAMRVSYPDRGILNAKPVVSWAGQLGEPVYSHVTPDGYPATRSFWNGPGQIEQRFEIARSIGSGYNNLFKPDGVALPLETTLPQVQGRRFDTLVAKSYSAPVQAALAQAKSPAEWNTLLLASPDFMGR
ncbi:DUF1800 domain-containing protein [Asticcacaulis solisilvae]|uniref:DUF1800 domain-containing protein n=1 Tax=Asticcacaulis solisilvae TaxID=1217274 RepID=UPI003FD8113B